MRHDHEDEHACNLGRAPDDLQELADERLEELEDLQEAEELKVDHKDDEDLDDVQGRLEVISHVSVKLVNHDTRRVVNIDDKKDEEDEISDAVEVGDVVNHALPAHLL